METELLDYSFHVLNIKLQSEKTDDERKAAYIGLLKRIVERRIHVRVSKDKHVIMYGHYEQKTRNGVDYVYGAVGKGIIFDNDGTTIDIEKGEPGKEQEDRSKIKQIISCDYVFLPASHRFCLEGKTRISPGDMKKFFDVALQEVVDPEDKVVVEIEHETTAIEEIRSANAIHKLSYRITYTNDDVLGPTGKQFDSRLKRLHVGKLELKATADHHGALDLNDEELLEGGMQIAKQNGTVWAEITDVHGARRWVSTESKILLTKIRATADNWRTAIANHINSRYKNTIEDTDDEQAFLKVAGKLNRL